MSESLLLNASLAGAAVTAALGIAAVVRGRDSSALARLALLLTGACLAGWVVYRWKTAGHAPLANQYESLVFLAFTAAWIVPFFRRARSWMLAVAGMSIAVLLGGAALLHAPVAPLMPALRSNWLLIHVAVTMASYGAFVLSGVAGGWLLLRRRVPGPGIEDLDGFCARTVEVGFFLLAVGIITGAVWANEAWGTWWGWDPKETWALITWIIYAIAIHLRRMRGWRNEKFAWLSILGLVSVGFTYFGVNYLLSGLHSYA